MANLQPQTIPDRRTPISDVLPKMDGNIKGERIDSDKDFPDVPIIDSGEELPDKGHSEDLKPQVFDDDSDSSFEDGNGSDNESLTDDTPSEGQGLDFQSKIDNLNKAIEDAYSILMPFADYKSKYGDASAYGLSGDMSKIGTGIINTLNAWQDLIQEKLDLNETNAASMAQSVYNTIFSLVNQQLTNDYALRNWYMQQDYNLPVNQIARLVDAGINPAFYYGSASKSNADAIGSPSDATGAQATLNPDNRTNEQVRRQQNMEIANATTSAMSQSYSSLTGSIKSLADANLAVQQAQSLADCTPAQVSAFLGQAAASNAQAEYTQAMQNAGVPQSTSAQGFANARKAEADAYTAEESNVYGLGKWSAKKVQAEALYNQANTLGVYEGIKQRWQELDNMIRIATMNNETSRYSARLGYAGTKYSADRSADTALETTRKNNILAWKLGKLNAKTQLNVQDKILFKDLAGQILGNMYSDEHTKAYYDVSTGKEITDKYDAGLKMKIGKFFEGGGSVDHTGKFTIGGRAIQEVEQSHRVWDRERTACAIRALNEFMKFNDKYGVDSPTFFKANFDVVQHLDGANKYWLPKFSHAITNMMMDSVQKNSESVGSSLQHSWFELW